LEYNVGDEGVRLRWVDGRKERIREHPLISLRIFWRTMRERLGFQICPHHYPSG
jgi:hypothetical protein